MRLTFCFIVASCLLLTLGFSCDGLWLPSDPKNVNNITGKVSDDREIIFKTEEMPKEAFVSFIEESTHLNDDEKKVIKETVGSKVYSHIKFSKYKQNGETFLEIHQSVPIKITGLDSEGHQRATGGFGSVSTYRLENNSWILVSSMFYD